MHVDHCQLHMCNQWRYDYLQRCNHEGKSPQPSRYVDNKNADPLFSELNKMEQHLRNHYFELAVLATASSCRGHSDYLIVQFTL